MLALGLTQRMAWGVAMPLALLAGVVLLGGAPFHFWVADLFQGASAALAPLAVAALQGLGALWLVRRLAGLEAFGAGADLAGTLLRTAAIAALLAGAGTLLLQRRPERRVGTLASLQGGLALAALAVSAGRGPLDRLRSQWLVPWAAHLALALSGATLLSRLTPTDRAPGEPGGHLFRRHPPAALAGLYSLFSLAGVPGTPGARLWLEVARSLAAQGHNGLLVAFALGWLAAFTAALRELRAGFGVPAEPRPAAVVPANLRAALWAAARPWRSWGGAGAGAVGRAASPRRPGASKGTMHLRFRVPVRRRRRPCALPLPVLLVALAGPGGAAPRGRVRHGPGDAAPAGDRHAGRRLLLVHRGVLRAAEGRRAVVLGVRRRLAADPTYEQVSTGATGHAEVVQVTFDPAVISYRELLRGLLRLSRPDHAQPPGRRRGRRSTARSSSGTRRSRRPRPRRLIAELSKRGVRRADRDRAHPLHAFYPAEDYHQGYYDRNRDGGYCRVVIGPKVEKLEKRYAARLKPVR